MRVLICGGRKYKDYDTFKTCLSAVQVTRGEFSVIIHGCATGADQMAQQYAERHIIPVLRFPAEWDKHGDAAGPIRNKRMLDEGKPDLVMAFPGDRGTANMIKQARQRKIDVWTY